MTANEKANIASFLDLAGDYLSGGFRRPREGYAFADDPADKKNPADAKFPAETESLPELPAVTETTEQSPTGEGDSLEAVAAEIAACTRCGLCSTRTNAVPGEGMRRPLVMVIGEGPGADEDETGRPFVGRAGQLLDRMLDSKGRIGLSRNSNCYIANIIKCRPPGNRTPQPDEITACVSYLVRQIKILKPRVILAAGNTAVKTLLDSTEGITRLRGTFTFFRGTLLMDADFNIPLLPTFHPSALLRDESLKAPVWEDMKALRAKLCELDGDYAARMADIPL
ncbi:MAG: uracil-DNA glycosylase [Spirochaetaceae bacterium]|jgi:DNA polymerase|nr:uracil-DNA glycosylase [Spirochaetaceae bacterium]